MADPTLDSTVAGADANSYASVTEADAYLNGRPFSSKWAAATAGAKIAALLEACILLDSCFQWTGAAATTTQALCWPRIGMADRNGNAIATDVLPRQLKQSQSEWALRLLVSDLVSDNTPLRQGLTSLKAGSVALSWTNANEASTPQMLDARTRMQGSDMAYLWKAVPDMVRNMLPLSWYNRPQVLQPILFGAIEL